MNPYAIGVRYGANILQIATHVRRSGLALRNSTSLKYSGQHSLTSTAMASINFGTALLGSNLVVQARFLCTGALRLSGETARSLASLAYTSVAANSWSEWQECYRAAHGASNSVTVGSAKLWGRSPAGGALKYELRCLKAMST